MINVMSQADDKALFCGNRNYLDEKHSVAKDQLAES
jgi:hypothetical protein